MTASTPGIQPVRLTATQLKLVALMTALSAMSYFDRTIMSIAGPVVMKDFGISEVAMGRVYFAALLSYTICMTPGGWLTDRFGPRRVLTATVLGTALLTGLTALCGNPGLGAILGVVSSFVIVRFLFGMTAAPLYPAIGRMAANWIPLTAQGWTQALIMAGSAWGAALSPLVFSRAIGAYGWRASFWMAAGLAALLGAIWFWAVRDHPPGYTIAASRARAASQWGKLLRDKNLILLTFAYFLINYFEYIFFYWIYYYFGEVRHLGKSETALATTILFLAMAVMTPLGGKLSDHLVSRYGLKFGRRSVAMAGMGASAVLVCFGAGGFGVVATVALLSLSFGFATSAEGPFWATAIEISGDQVGAGCGIFNTGGNLGGMLAPLITPMIAVHFGWAAGLYFGSLLVLIGMLLWLLIDL